MTDQKKEAIFLVVASIITLPAVFVGMAYLIGFIAWMGGIIK